MAQESRVDYLGECRAKQIPYSDSTLLRLIYREVERRLYHSPRPWMTREIPKHGEILLGRNLLIQYDTVTTERGEYVTTTQISPGELLRRNYRERRYPGRRWRSSTASGFGLHATPLLPFLSEAEGRPPMLTWPVSDRYRVKSIYPVEDL